MVLGRDFMKALKVPLIHAERAKQWLFKTHLIDNSYIFFKDKKSMFFPVISEVSTGELNLLNAKSINKVFKKKEKSEKDIRHLLSKKLNAQELELVKTSYDVIGSIIIIEMPELLKKKEKIIAAALLKLHKNARTVAKKAGIHEGVFRTQKLKVLAGSRTTKTVYRENNVAMNLDVEKVYFSPRLSNERKRIASVVKTGEKVLVMFSGCAPYPLVISKNSKAKEIYAIEINPAAHKYARENVKLNKARNIKLFYGDVREIVPILNKKFDRIVMPLPRGGEDFLFTALLAAHSGTVIHFYDFLNEEEIPKAAIAKIENACQQSKKKFKILRHVKCGQFGPRIYRICVDFRIL